MSLIHFTQNHEDLSTDRGFQFKFFCDRCGNGYLSPFETSVPGIAGDILRTAGNLFGGILGRVSDSSYEIQQSIGGKAHDEALQRAVESAKAHFKQCSRCGKWVCPENCWNSKRGLCEECAPDLEEEMAAAQAHAVKDQVWQKAAEGNLIQDVDMTREAVASCAECGAKAQSGKFCGECGTSLRAKTECGNCGAEVEAKTKFCPECGNKMEQ
ncbi:MAG: zinc ribbon domain-containing protein [Ardenticatenales bacterium]|nr:zinc ribbon domain-containing protein [Ardenticatenales bacterium]